MPAPRRKSCFNCVKSKRKCDVGTPSCERCRSRGLDCDYGDVTAGHKKDLGDGFEGFQTQHGFDQLQDFPVLGDGEGDPMARDLSTGYDNTWLAGPEGFRTQKGFRPRKQMAILQDGPQGASIFGGESELGHQHPSNQTTDNSTPDFRIPSLSDGTLSWSDLMTDIDDFVVTESTWQHLAEERPITSGEIYYARTVFAMKQLKTWPKMFLDRVHNPFIHRHLFEEGLPTSLIDAMSSCALYAGKNDENQIFVFQDISQKAKKLIGEHHAWSSSPLEQLAAVQALILYNTIRLSDGDIRLRADAELSEPVLISWTDQLKTRMQPLYSLDSESTQPITTDWYGWIFAESVRRTVLVSYMLRGIYMFLKQGWDDVSSDVNPLTFTGQSALWNAPSEFLWQEAVNMGRHICVTVGDWDRNVGDSEAAEMEDLGVMMLAIHKGLDGMVRALPEGAWARYGIDWRKRPAHASTSLSNSISKLSG
jgi:Fungal Zn(2)-Cys(6) binuclear cluster domain